MISLTDCSGNEISSILERQTISRINNVNISMCASKYLWIISLTATSKQNSSPVGAGSHCSSPNRTSVSLRRATTDSFNPPGGWLAISRPVMLNREGGGDIHEKYLVLLVARVPAWYISYQHNVGWFPVTKPIPVPVGRRIVLSEYVTGDVLRSLE